MFPVLNGQQEQTSSWHVSSSQRWPLWEASMRDLSAETKPYSCIFVCYCLLTHMPLNRTLDLISQNSHVVSVASSQMTTPGVECDSCNVRFHQACLAMKNEVYSNLKNVSWHCFTSGIHLLKSVWFNPVWNIQPIWPPWVGVRLWSRSRHKLPKPFGHILTLSWHRDHSNMASLRLHSVSGCDEPLLHPSFSHDSIIPQTVRASTKQRKDILFKLINVNCQSLVVKKTSLSTLCEMTDADIVLGTESWRTTTQRSSLPDTRYSEKIRRKVKVGAYLSLLRRPYKLQNLKSLPLMRIVSYYRYMLWLRAPKVSTSDACIDHQMGTIQSI